MKKLFFIFSSALFILTTNCFSQIDTLVSKPDSTFTFPLIVKTTPLSLIDIANGGCAVINLESFPVKKLSVSMELGTYYPLAGYGIKKLKGWRSGFELRYFFNENKNWDYFFGANYFTKKINFSKTDSIKIDLTEGSYSRNYSVNKDVSVIDFEFGKRNFNPGKKFVSEFYFGLGIRFKNTTCSGLTETEMDHRLLGNSLFAPIIFRCGNFILPDFLFGYKIGFGVKKHQ